MSRISSAVLKSRALRASVRFAISSSIRADNAKNDNALSNECLYYGPNALPEGCLYDRLTNEVRYSVISLLGNPYAKKENITEKRQKTSVMLISYAEGDVGVTMDTEAPVVEIVTTVDYVDWEVEKTKYITTGKITATQNNQFINFIKTRIDLDNDYSSCSSGENNNCDATRNVGIGKYIRFDIYLDEVEYHVVDFNTLFVDLENGLSDISSLTTDHINVIEKGYNDDLGKYVYSFEVVTPLMDKTVSTNSYEQRLSALSQYSGYIQLKLNEEFKDGVLNLKYLSSTQGCAKKHSLIT